MVAKTTWYRVKEQKSCQHYPTEECINAATAAHLALVTQLSEVDVWKPVLEVGLERTKLVANEKTFREAISELEEYRVIMAKIKIVVTAARVSGQRKIRLARDHYVALFREIDDKCPGCVSKTCGDSLYTRIDRPGSFGITTQYAGAVFDSSMAKEKSTWSFPRLLLAPDDIEDKTLITHWHKECYARIVGNMDAISAKTDEALVSMRTNNQPSGCGSIQPNIVFAFNDPEVKDMTFFEADGNLRMPVICQRTGWACTAFRFFPYRLHQHFLHVVKGTCCVIIIPGTQIEDRADLLKYLEDLPTTALAKCPTFTLSAGSSLWIPLGYYPLIIGCPTCGLSETAMDQRKEDKAKCTAPKIDSEHVSVALTLCYDSSAKNADESLRMHILTCWTRAQAYVFHGIKNELTEWLASLEVPAAQAIAVA